MWGCDIIMLQSIFVHRSTLTYLPVVIVVTDTDRGAWSRHGLVSVGDGGGRAVVRTNGPDAEGV
jgi:hypothetical protein